MYLLSHARIYNGTIQLPGPAGKLCAPEFIKPAEELKSESEPESIRPFCCPGLLVLPICDCV